MWVTSSYIQIWLWPGLLTNVNLEKNSEIRANYVTAHSVYLLSNNPEMSQLISIFLIFKFLQLLSICLIFIYLIHLIHLFIYLFLIFRHPPSAIRYPPSAISHPLSVSSFYRLLTWGAFQTQDLAVAGPWPDRSFWPERNRLFQRVLLKNRIFRAPYLVSEWDSWIVLIKSEIFTYDKKELAAHFWQIESTLHHF